MKRELPEGTSASVLHLRRFAGVHGYARRRDMPAGTLPLAKGGMTYVYVRDAGGRLVAIGSAKCSKSDNYSKKLGRTIALGRALAFLSGDAERRGGIFSMKPGVII